MQTVDYRMARRAVLQDLQRGLKARPDVCDAHPELVRAARFVGEEIDEACPVCEKEPLRVVFYTYGKDLRGREQGRVRRREDLPELRARFGDFVIYAVEVCTGCSWNHLVRSFTSGFKHAV
jgi:hypothetical protein